DNETRALFYDHGGRLWSGSKSGALRVYDPATGSVLYLHADGRLDENHQVFAGAGIYNVFEDSEGRIWIGTKGDGLFVLKPLPEKSFRLSKYVHDSTRPFSISDDEVYSVFEDSRGRIWIGCFREGINLVEVGENGEFRFINRRNRIKQYPGGGFTSVRYLTEGPDGVILVGTAGGLLTFDAGRDDWEGLYFYRNVHRTPEGTGMSGGNVMHILRTRKDEIFVTTFDGGFQKVVSDRLLSDTLRFRNYHSGHDNTIPGLVLAAVEDTGGQIWIISEDAVTCFDPVCERFELFNVNTFIRGNYFSEAIPLIDRQGRILTGMYGGISYSTPAILSAATTYRRWFLPRSCSKEARPKNSSVAIRLCSIRISET
ncbi:MAG: hypothetical protein LUE21_01215, partial [Oscillospiraceae bacterium]|nr:hypothetical protein [Oscillospiraceae bacterium]